MTDLGDRRYSTAIEPTDARATVAGWIQEVRDLGGIAFVILRDREDTLQVVLPKDDVDDDIVETLLDLNRESVVAVEGPVQASDQARHGYEILPEDVDVLGEAEAPLPLGVADEDVESELDTRLDNRFLDLRKPEVRAIFEVRDTVLQAGRSYFREEGFTEIHTPRIIASASEGGTELFTVEYFDREAYLAQSPQLYKQQMMATGLDRICEVATYFRAEKHSTRRHLNEITAFDIEMAFVEDEEDVMEVLEGVTWAVWNAVHEDCQEQLEALDVEVPVPERPFPRVTYDEAVDWLDENGYDPIWGEDLTSEQEYALGDHMVEQGTPFYFIKRYPDAAKPFYIHPEDELSRSFDLAHRGMELTSGGQRVHDVDMLRTRIRDQGLDPKDFQDYLKAFRYGMPPHGGFGYGVDRITMEILNLQNIREGVLWPRDRERLTP